MNKTFYKYQNYFFNTFIFISYLLLFLSIFGFPQFSMKYLPIIDYYIRIYICLFLIIRFNPLRYNYEFTELDRKIAFSAGLLILTTSALNTYIEIIKEKSKEIFHKTK